jgi:hypothetical protein
LVVKRVAENGGRFLKRYGIDSTGSILWVEIGQHKAVEKASQALREGAPEIRRQNAHSKIFGTDETFSSRSTYERTLPKVGEDHHANEKPAGSRGLLYMSSFEEEQKNDGVLAIEPSMILLGRQQSHAISLPVDQLEPTEREMYLNHFYPPNSALEGKRHRQISQEGRSRSRRDEGHTVGSEDGNYHTSFENGHSSHKRVPKKCKSGVGEWPIVTVEI